MKDTEMNDTKFIAPYKLGYHWIGNSGKSTVEDVIRGYVEAFNYSKDELVAEPFTPEAGIKFAVYRKLKED